MPIWEYSCECGETFMRHCPIAKADDQICDCGLKGKRLFPKSIFGSTPTLSDGARQLLLDQKKYLESPEGARKLREGSIRLEGKNRFAEVRPNPPKKFY